MVGVRASLQDEQANAQQDRWGVVVAWFLPYGTWRLTDAAAERDCRLRNHLMPRRVYLVSA